jgi:hypothetical protein
MFQKPGCNEEFVQALADHFKNATGPLEPVSIAARNLARFLGLRAVQVYVIIDGRSIPVDECVSADPDVHEQIACLINGLAASV